MSFLYLAALGIGLLAAAPFIAHLLQRRRAEERDFPPARLVPASPPVARKRRKVDDRALYGVRTASVLALALLGATPFFRCSSLAIGRQGGASIALALVLDDSLSMSARSGSSTRWERAKSAALDLVSGAREGDAIGVVLAGSPPRIALATTTDLGAARSVIAGLVPSHRATDLESALELARSLVHGLPQNDRRVVLLSDLADGHPEAAPLDSTGELPLWVPLSDQFASAANCGLVRADRQRDHVTVRVGCSPPEQAKGRTLELLARDKVVASAPLPSELALGDLALDVQDAPGELVARLNAGDAIAADDSAPVLTVSADLAVAVIADPANAKLVTGGAPPVEQAVEALELGLRVRPLPAVPDHLDDLTAFAGLIIEDPPGFTPEARRSLANWLERGGVALLALGPHAAMAPLGASFEPFVAGAISWGPSPVPGIDEHDALPFGAAAGGLLDVRPRGRATLDPSALGGSSSVAARWKDGAPWLVERPLGRGFVYVLTLPTSAEMSDLGLRPAFLQLLETFADAARARNGAHRTPVGESWSFEGATSLEVTGPSGVQLHTADDDGRKAVVPDLLGRYEIKVDRDTLVRVAAPVERELDLRPRGAVAGTRASSLGDTRAKVDLSPYVAGVLLLLFVAELGLRAHARATSVATPPPATGEPSRPGSAAAERAPWQRTG